MGLAETLDRTRKLGLLPAMMGAKTDQEKNASKLNTMYEAMDKTKLEKMGVTPKMIEALGQSSEDPVRDFTTYLSTVSTMTKNEQEQQKYPTEIKKADVDLQRSNVELMSSKKALRESMRKTPEFEMVKNAEKTAFEKGVQIGNIQGYDQMDARTKTDTLAREITRMELEKRSIEQKIGARSKIEPLAAALQRDIDQIRSASGKMWQEETPAVAGTRMAFEQVPGVGKIAGDLVTRQVGAMVDSLKRLSGRGEGAEMQQALNIQDSILPTLAKMKFEVGNLSFFEQINQKKLLINPSDTPEMRAKKIEYLQKMIDIASQTKDADQVKAFLEGNGLLSGKGSGKVTPVTPTGSLNLSNALEGL